MTARILPRDEYSKLAGTELETVWPLLPETAVVIVVEHDAQIVGTWALFPLTHVEGCWIAPEHRGKAVVAGHLVRTMRAVARSMGARAVVTASTSIDVSSLLAKLGAVQLPGEHFSLKVGA